MITSTNWHAPVVPGAKAGHFLARGRNRDWERGQALFQVSGFPEIVISFGARGGGAEFALWLREQIQKKTGLMRPTQVYIDTIGMLNEQFDETALTLGGTETAGIFKARNAHWAGYFTYALQSAHTVIFVVTREWMASKNARDEYYWFNDLSWQDPGKRKGISLVIDLEDSASLWARLRNRLHHLRGTTEVRATREWELNPAQRRSIKGNLKNLWKIGTSDLGRLFAAM
jgi:hypothetical protein